MNIGSNTATFTKQDIQDRFNISFETVNNWIKTRIIPPPKFAENYTKEEYLSLIKSVEKNENKLRTRANRSYKKKDEIVFLGIKDKKRKELLIALVEMFRKSNLSVLDAVCLLGKKILIDNDLYQQDSDICQKLKTAHNVANIFDTNIFNSFHIENKNDDILGYEHWK